MLNADIGWLVNKNGVKLHQLDSQEDTKCACHLLRCYIILVERIGAQQWVKHLGACPGQGLVHEFLTQNILGEWLTEVNLPIERLDRQ